MDYPNYNYKIYSFSESQGFTELTGFQLNVANYNPDIEQKAFFSDVNNDGLSDINYIVNSSEISVSGKLCAFFSFFFNLWAVASILLGFLGMVGIYLSYNFNESIFFISFIVTVFFYSGIPIFIQKKWMNFLYFPLMFIFYLGFTIIIFHFLLERYILKIKPKFVKATS